MFSMLAAIKAINPEDLTLDVLGMPHGIDRAGQRFDAATDLGDLPVIPVVYYHGYAEEARAKVERIGWATKGERNGEGQWYRVTLDSNKPLARKIYTDAAKGLVRASSDAIAHLVRPLGILGKPGYVSSWPIAALSLMDERTYSLAFNQRAIALPALKALYDEYLAALSQSGEADAAKAGQIFAARNRDRILRMKEALQSSAAVLDEMLKEFPAATTSEAPDMAMSMATPDAAKAEDVLAWPVDELKAYVAARVSQRRGLSK